jgi:hypothetical protein
MQLERNEKPYWKTGKAKEKRYIEGWLHIP